MPASQFLPHSPSIASAMSNSEMDKMAGLLARCASQLEQLKVTLC